MPDFSFHTVLLGKVAHPRDGIGTVSIQDMPRDLAVPEKKGVLKKTTLMETSLVVWWFRFASRHKGCRFDPWSGS